MANPSRLEKPIRKTSHDAPGRTAQEAWRERIAPAAAAAFASAAGLLGTSAHAAGPSEQPFGLRPDLLVALASRSSATTAADLGAAWTWRWTQPLGAYGMLAGQTEATIGHWWIRRERAGESGSATRLGITPILRWQRQGGAGPFLEAGIGLNLIAPVYATADKRFSTVFNFGDHIGIGWRTAGATPWEWSLRVQHFSNGSIRKPNPGENFVQLRLAIGF